jgi:hypothetical protein
MEEGAGIVIYASAAAISARSFIGDVELERLEPIVATPDRSAESERLWLVTIPIHPHDTAKRIFGRAADFDTISAFIFLQKSMGFEERGQKALLIIAG